MVTGSCLCGGVAWQVEGDAGDMSHCHCSMCRKSHGTAYGTYVGFPSAAFRWLRGEDRIVQYESSKDFRRPFCGGCGSVVPGAPHDGRLFMPAGPLDGDPGARPIAHLFVTSKAPWWSIDGDLPRFDAYPPGYPTPVLAPVELGAAEPGVIRGSCLCGDVRFELTGDHEAIFCCHCSRCRKARSAAHATNLFVAHDEFRWTAGEDRVADYKIPEAERFTQAFCRRCGSIMPHFGASRVMVPAGALDDDPGARPALHIHVDAKAPWSAIEDDLPRHPDGPGSGTSG